jgi:hypothetical protein
MKFKHRAAIAIFSALLSTRAFAAATVTAKNDLDIPRPSETIELKWSDVGTAVSETSPATITVTDSSGKEIPSQTIDSNADGKPDLLIFQSDFAPNESKTFTLDNKSHHAGYDAKVFCRYVPERLDDFAWESDKIAYRTYGPALEKADPAGSGIDVWCKKVPKLIINEWYKKAEGPQGGYYHVDHGEGLDCYKTGHSRGCGGTAVWKNGQMYTNGTKGYKTWKVFANGPIRCEFELTYDPWDAAGEEVSEVKRISLDAGHHLMKIQSTFATNNADQTARIPIAIGVQHHDKPGQAAAHKDEGWIRYWDAGDLTKGVKDNGNIGTGAVMDASKINDAMDTKDHVVIITSATPGEPITYFAGAGWDKSPDIHNLTDWDNHLAQCAKRVMSPIKVTVGQ